MTSYFRKPKYIFFGSPEFAEIVLGKLIEANLPPLAVVTNPDRPVGRKKVITPPPVKVLAEKNNIKVLQPEKIDENIISEIKTISPDFFVIAAYSKILPGSILAIPPKGSIGVHPSLLPKYRGASPIQSALLNGENETGATLYILDEKVDHGPILAEKGLSIGPEEAYTSLLMRLAELGGNLAAETLPSFAGGKIQPTIQSETEATFTKKFTADSAFVDENDLRLAQSGENGEMAKKIHNIIRALNPEPGVWTMRDGKRMKILNAELDGERLRLTTIQYEGKTPQKIFS